MNILYAFMVSIFVIVLFAPLVNGDMTEKPNFGVIDVDDKVEVAMLLGGWGIERPIITRGDGMPCDTVGSMPLYPQGPFVDAAVAHIPHEGIILCGGLLGDRDSYVATNKCYFMDHKKSILNSDNLRLFEMNNQSKVPVVFGSNQLDGKMIMASLDTENGFEPAKLYLHANATGFIYLGKLHIDPTCRYEIEQCSRLQISWIQLTHYLPTFRDLRLRSHPCMVVFHRRLYLLGGLSEEGWPMRVAFGLTRNFNFIVDGTLTVPGGARAYHACYVHSDINLEKDVLYLQGGIQHPHGLTYSPNDLWMTEGGPNGWKRVATLTDKGHRAGHGLVHLSIGRKGITNLLAIGGILVNDQSTVDKGNVTTYETTDTVVHYDGHNWETVDAKMSRIPAMARFALAVIPFNNTAPSCECVPDLEHKKCFYIEDPGNREDIRYFNNDAAEKLRFCLFYFLFTFLSIALINE